MKKNRKHIAVCGALILIAVLAEYVVYLHYDSLRANPVILNSRMAVAPVYNTDGSWLHGRWGIGYDRTLLCVENMTALVFAGYIFRMIASYNAFFGLSAGWLYIVDLEIAVPIYRLLLWLIPSLYKYHLYKKERTADMSVMQKLKWEFRMSGRILYLPFLRKSGWEDRFEKWRAE